MSDKCHIRTLRFAKRGWYLRVQRYCKVALIVIYRHYAPRAGARIAIGKRRVGYPCTALQVLRLQSWYTPRHSKDGICFKDRQSRYRARQLFMHCCLAASAAAKVREVRPASLALSVLVPTDRSTTKSTGTAANNCLLHFMAQPPFRLKNAASLKLLQGCVDGNYRGAGTIRTLTCRPNGESIATPKSGCRSVYVRRPVYPLQPPVPRPL